MKTIVALFQDYMDAEEAVDALLEEGFGAESINVLVREDVAKENLDVDLHEVDVRKTDSVGEQTVRGMAEILGGEQPVHVADVGDVLAGGELATILAKDAASSFAPGMALAKALQDFGIPQDVATAYQEGVNSSGLLVLVRTADDRASVAANLMEAENGEMVGDYT